MYIDNLVLLLSLFFDDQWKCKWSFFPQKKMQTYRLQIGSGLCWNVTIYCVRRCPLYAFYWSVILNNISSSPSIIGYHVDRAYLNIAISRFIIIILITRSCKQNMTIMSQVVFGHGRIVGSLSRTVLLLEHSSLPVKTNDYVCTNHVT
jgi:hypothetical protein